MSTLDTAYEDVLARRRRADDAGDWGERSVLEPLVDIADYLRRVADHPDSSHYRADKAGPLLSAAVSLQREVFLARAGWPEDDTPAGRLIVEGARVLDAACTAVRRALWGVTEAELYGGPVAVYVSAARELTKAASAFDRWARSVAAEARPDPEEGW